MIHFVAFHISRTPFMSFPIAVTIFRTIVSNNLIERTAFISFSSGSTAGSVNDLNYRENKQLKKNGTLVREDSDAFSLSTI